MFITEAKSGGDNPAQYSNPGNKDHQQAWLKVMENTELRQAVEASKCFYANEEHHQYTQNRQLLGVTQTKDAQPLNQVSMPITEDSSRIDQGKSAVKPINQEKIVSISHRSLETANIFPGLPSAPVDYDAVTKTDHENIPSTRGLHLLQKYGETVNWQPWHISLLHSKNGMELWIRDSDLSESKLTHMLSLIQGRMAKIGLSLVKVSLNGTTFMTVEQ